MELLERIPIELDPEGVLKNIHVDGEMRARLDVEGLLETATLLVRPRALYTPTYVTSRKEDVLSIGPARFESRVLARNLEEVDRVFPYVITIGRELEDEASTHKNILKQLFLERLGDFALRSARTYLGKHLAERNRLGKISSIGPGQLDWSITQQGQLFSILGDVEGMIGVTLTKDFLMIPRKSVSGIMFPTEVTFTSCQLCPRDNCMSRRAPYDESLRRSYGLDTK